MNKRSLIFLSCASIFLTSAAFANNYYVHMVSSNGISDVPAAPFQFSINHGSWHKVKAGKTVNTYPHKAINGIQIKFGSGTANAVTVNCHKYIPQGLQDTASNSPSNKGIPVYSKINSFNSSITTKGKHNITFILTGLGSMLCNAYAADCMVYDCTYYAS